jgi:hypothetical protein
LQTVHLSENWCVPWIDQSHVHYVYKLGWCWVYDCINMCKENAYMRPH